MKYLEINKYAEDSLRNQKESLKNNVLILKSQQRYRSQKYNVFTEGVNKTVLGANNDKIIQSIIFIEAKIQYLKTKKLNAKI